MLFTKHKKGKRNDKDIVAIADGEMISLEQVQDDVFRKKLLGDGVAFKLHEETISSPVHGRIDAVFPTGHAFGITADNGMQFMIHIGIDTVKNKGKGFHVKVKQGDYVKAGQPLIQIDLHALSKVYDMTTMLIITEPQNHKITFCDYGPVSKGQRINKTEERV